MIKTSYDPSDAFTAYSWMDTDAKTLEYQEQSPVRMIYDDTFGTCTAREGKRLNHVPYCKSIETVEENIFGKVACPAEVRVKQAPQEATSVRNESCQCRLIERLIVTSIQQVLELLHKGLNHVKVVI
jgi:hypothetical protein